MYMHGGTPPMVAPRPPRPLPTAPTAHRAAAEYGKRLPAENPAPLHDLPGRSSMKNAAREQPRPTAQLAAAPARRPRREWAWNCSES
eukprot:SAG31_NODE_23371_length_505_cov_3.012315_1_plen_86_part_10